MGTKRFSPILPGLFITKNNYAIIGYLLPENVFDAPVWKPIS